MEASIVRALLWRLLRIALALLPWCAALSMLYWLEHGGIWQAEQAYRGLISVAVLAAGMLGSLLLHGVLHGRYRRN